MTKEEYITKSQKIKGEIIGQMSHVELRMSYIIATHLSKKQSLDYIMFLLNKVNFRNKLDVFRSMINKNKKLKSAVYKDIFEDLMKLQKKRNTLAHSMINTEGIKDFSIAKSIRLMNSNDLGVSKKSYSFRDRDLDMEKITKIQKCFNVMLSPKSKTA
jgi:hypothetical protein